MRERWSFLALAASLLALGVYAEDMGVMVVAALLIAASHALGPVQETAHD